MCDLELNVILLSTPLTFRIGKATLNTIIKHYKVSCLPVLTYFTMHVYTYSTKHKTTSAHLFSQTTRYTAQHAVLVRCGLGGAINNKIISD